MMARFDEGLFEASLYNKSDKWTNDTLSELPTCKGVLLFCDACDRPIQLLQAANLRRTARAKLLDDSDSLTPRRADIGSLVSRLLYVCCHNDFISQLTYIHLTHTVFGTSTADWIQLPKLSLAVIEPNTRLPYFYVSENLSQDNRRQIFGLFPNRKATARLVDILNTVFGLCLNPSLLNTGRESSCPYLQMQTCPGPCLKADLHECYMKSVRQAIRTVSGDSAMIIQELVNKMNEAAKSMRFEEAAVLKKKCEQLKLCSGSDYTFVHPLDKLNLLHIDMFGKRKPMGTNKKYTIYKAWKITAQGVFELGIFTPHSNKQVRSFLLSTWNTDRKVIYTQHHKEHLAVLQYFLFRSKHTGLWLDCTNGITGSVYNLMNDKK